MTLNLTLTLAVTLTLADPLTLTLSPTLASGDGHVPLDGPRGHLS